MIEVTEKEFFILLEFLKKNYMRTDILGERLQEFILLCLLNILVIGYL